MELYQWERNQVSQGRDHIERNSSPTVSRYLETTLLFEDIFRCLEVETKENSPFWNLEVETFDWKGAPFWKEATEETFKKPLKNNVKISPN